MAGSAAEERIRAKVEARMRRAWPAGRIIHELQLEQGGVRIDLACVTSDQIIVAEIKSEKDVLKRANRQIGCAVDRADEVWFVFAEHHAEAVRGRLLAYYLPQPEGRRSVCVENPERVRHLRLCEILMEKEQDKGLWLWPDGSGNPWPDPRRRFQLLWADEMLDALGRHFGGAQLPPGQMTRGRMTKLAVEHMTGRELRRAVCAQLRNRPFPRADLAANAVVEAAGAPLL